MRSVEYLEGAVRGARDELAALEAELRHARMAGAGIAVGDIVTFRGVEYIVRKADPWSYGVSLKGSKRRKNGEWSKTVQYIGTGWKKVS